MDEITYCLDTYALVEIFRENPKFSRYLNLRLVVSSWTLSEFYWILLKQVGQTSAGYWFNKIEPYSVEPDIAVLKSAIEFRFENRKQDLSFFDAVGYIFSRSHGYWFVTGDKEFEHLAGVEFMKK